MEKMRFKADWGYSSSLNECCRFFCPLCVTIEVAETIEFESSAPEE
jgi:hypothetical protein